VLEVLCPQHGRLGDTPQGLQLLLHSSLKGEEQVQNMKIETLRTGIVESYRITFYKNTKKSFIAK
jgi:hypothetical protein